MRCASNGTHAPQQTTHTDCGDPGRGFGVWAPVRPHVGADQPDQRADGVGPELGRDRCDQFFAAASR